MEFFVDVAEVAIGDVGIDLSSANVCVAQKSLNRAEIGTIWQKIGSKDVSDNVGSHFFRNTSFDTVMFDYTLNWATG